MKYMIAIPILIFCFCCNQKEPEIPEEKLEVYFKPAEVAGIIMDSALQEASGMIASRSNPGTFWVINDSGNEPALYLINEAAALQHTFWLKDLENRDWEDLTFFKDKLSEKNMLVIGDIGDNFSQRDHINIIILEEPELTGATDTLVDNFNVYKIKYADGPRDAETILFDPVTNKFYIISKREENVGIFELPEKLSETDTMELKQVSNLPFQNITSGDITIDGKEILLKTYDSIFYWNRNTDQMIISELSKEHIQVDYKIEPQGESICWNLDGSGFYTLSEKSWASQQVLYYYEKSAGD